MTTSEQSMNKDMDVDTSMDIDTPRDVRLLHLLLASQAIHQYEEKVPLQLMDFAYRYTKGVLKDAMIYNEYKMNNLVEDNTPVNTTSNKELNVDSNKKSGIAADNNASGNTDSRDTTTAAAITFNTTDANADSKTNSSIANSNSATTVTTNTVTATVTTTTATTTTSNTNTSNTTSTNTGNNSSNLAPGQLTIEDIRLAIASRTQYQFKPTAPKELLLKLASERNKKPLPQVMGSWGVRLPPEKYCLTAKEWGINQNK